MLGATAIESPRSFMPLDAAHALVETLAAHGVDRVFCVPGESYLAVLNALYDTPAIHTIACRHESGAGYMAVADAKLTGRPGIVFASRGPGACNAAIALHTAQQDAAPLVLFVGQVDRASRGKRAFQEVDYPRTFGDIAKWVVEVEDGAQLPAIAARALSRAASGIPGSVVVSLPEDMLGDAAAGAAVPEAVPAPAAPVPAAVAEVAQRLARAERPLLIVGTGCAAARGLLRQVAERYTVPVAVSFRQQHLFPNLHPLYAGHLGYNIPARHLEILAPADLVLAVGTRLGDVTTQGYRFPKAPIPEQPLIHVHRADEALNATHQASIAITAEPTAFFAALLVQAPSALPARAGWVSAVNGYARQLIEWHAVQAADGVVFGAVVAALRALAPEDAVITQDAGNFSGWMHRYFVFGEGAELLAPISGAMGFGVPAAVAAALRFPRRKVICLVGDGGFLMTGNELATAVQYGAAPLIILADNNSYGTIRQHQEKHYPGRVMATDLRNPDFAALGRAFGAASFTIGPEDDIAGVLRQALAASGPALVQVRTSLGYISAFAKLPDRES